MLKACNPAKMVEIGSGVSTKYARRAIRRYDLRTHLTSIDPEPRNQVDRLCDEVVRLPLERVDPAQFEALEPGDLVIDIAANDGTLLRAYREDATTLDGILDSGTFNCVSSAVLYALAAGSLGVEVAGVRTSDHAFCTVMADGALKSKRPT